jgi:hypothetical protein
VKKYTKNLSLFSKLKNALNNLPILVPNWPSASLSRRLNGRTGFGNENGGVNYLIHDPKWFDRIVACDTK